MVRTHPAIIMPKTLRVVKHFVNWPTHLLKHYGTMTSGSFNSSLRIITVIPSDGLADPFSDDAEPNAGFELEALVETGDAIPDPLYESRLFALAYGVSQQCADDGGVREPIDRLGLLSLELPLGDYLQPVATAIGTAGVLLGILPPDFATEFTVPGGNVRVVTAQLPWSSELDFAALGGKAGREELARRFVADGSYHRSSLNRRLVA